MEYRGKKKPETFEISGFLHFNIYQEIMRVFEATELEALLLLYSSLIIELFSYPASIASSLPQPPLLGLGTSPPLIPSHLSRRSLNDCVPMIMSPTTTVLLGKYMEPSTVKFPFM